MTDKPLDKPPWVCDNAHSLIKQSKVKKMSATPTVVKGILYWANLKEVNEMSGKFQVDVGGLSDAAVDAIQEMGISVNNKQDERGNFITCKSKNPIRAYDPSGEEITAPIGNGSLAKVGLSFYDWTWKNKEGRSPSIVKLIVTELEEYESIDLTDEDLEAAL